MNITSLDTLKTQMMLMKDTFSFKYAKNAFDSIIIDFYCYRDCLDEMLIIMHVNNKINDINFETIENLRKYVNPYKKEENPNCERILSKFSELAIKIITKERFKTFISIRFLPNGTIVVDTKNESEPLLENDGHITLTKLDDYEELNEKIKTILSW